MKILTNFWQNFTKNDEIWIKYGNMDGTPKYGKIWKIWIDNSLSVLSTYAKTMFFVRFTTQLGQEKNMEIHINPIPNYKSTYLGTNF